MDRAREGRRGAAATSNSSKRRRQEQHPQAYDREETSEEGTEMASAAGVSDEEDDEDLPPSMASRHAWKLKHQYAKPQEDASPVDLAAPVPRKLRTAMMKRYQGSPPHVTDSSKQQQLSNAGAPCNLGTPSANSNSAALNASSKSGRRTKPSNPNKPRPAKLPKISPSKQEVEVAETLYDLARMVATEKVPSMTVQESKAEPKLEVKPEIKAGAANSVASLLTPAVHSPQSTQCATSPGIGPSVTAVNSLSPTHTPGSTGAQKRKHLHVSSKAKDGGQQVASAAASPCLSTNSLGAAPELADAEQVQLQIEASRSPSTGLPAGSEKTFTTNSPSSSTNASAPALQCKSPQIVENTPAFLGEKEPKIDTASDALAEFTSTKVSVIVADRSSDIIENSIASEALTRVDIGERLVRPTISQGACPAKFEIDLMSPPKTSDEKADDSLNFSKSDGQEEKEVNLPDIHGVVKNTLLEKDNEKDEPKDKSKNTEVGKELERPIEKTESDWCKDLKPENNCEKFRESADQMNCLKDRGMQNVDKQVLQESSKEPDLRVHKVDEFVASGLAASTITTMVNSVANIPSLISMGVAGWPGGIPPLRYYSPAAEAGVAAAWPTPISVASTSSEEKGSITPQIPSLRLSTRQSWKCSATHVFIARFIDFQQQASRNPPWAAAYGNSTGLYGASMCNLNIPIAPPDGIFGNSTGSILMETPLSNASGLGGTASRISAESLNEIEPCPTVLASASARQTVDRSPSSYIDALGRKTVSQQQLQTGQQQPTSSHQAGSNFGFPITQSAAVSGIDNTVGTGITAGDNKGLSAALRIGGSSDPINTLSVGTGSGSTNGSVANAAAAQFLHSVIQQSAFPFQFPPGHFGPTFGGHLPPPQASQFLNPFYGSQLVQPTYPPQQSQQVVNVSSGAADSQKQQHQRSQSACNFVASGSAQQHSWSPSHGIQTPIGSALQQPQQLNGKENMAEDRGSVGELKLSMAHRNIYKQNLASLQVSTVSSSSSVLAPGMPILSVRPQDFSLTAAFGGKQTGKMQAQAEMPLQSHHHSLSHLQQQQHQLQAATQHHVAIPALQMSLKDVDSHTSQSLTTINISRASAGPNFLGAPAVTSVMVPQGHTFFNNTVDTLKAHVQPSMATHNQSVSGHSHPYFMSSIQQQQQHPAQMQRLVSSGFEDVNANTNESTYIKGGHIENRKAHVKCQPNQPYLARGDLEASTYVQGSPVNATGSTTNNGGLSRNLMVPNSEDRSSASVSISIPAQQPIQNSKKQTIRSKAGSISIVSSAPTEVALGTFSDRSPVHAATFAGIQSGHGLPFPGQGVNAANQCITQGHAQQSSQVKAAQRASPGLSLPLTSGAPSQAMLAAIGRSHGQQSKNDQSATDMIPTSRASPAPSVSSFCDATSLSPPLASKSGSTVVSSSGSSVKDSYCLPQKPSSGAASTKRNSPAIAPNVASILGPSPMAQNLSPKSPQIQMIQNQHIIQQQPQQQPKKQQQKQQQRKQQQMTQPLLQQSAQSMMSPQRLQQQQPALQQHYHLQHSLSNQQHGHQIHKQALAQQQQQLQLQEHFIAPQNPHSVQTSSQTQQMGNMPQQHLKHLHQHQHQQILSTPFGMAVNGGLSGNLTIGTNAGNSPRNIVSDGMVISQSTNLRPSTPSKSTVNTNVSPPVPQKINNSGPVFLHSDYGSASSAPSSQQQISNSNTVFPSFSNPVSQPISISSTSVKLNDDKPMKGN